MSRNSNNLELLNERNNFKADNESGVLSSKGVKINNNEQFRIAKNGPAKKNKKSIGSEALGN